VYSFFNDVREILVNLIFERRGVKIVLFLMLSVLIMTAPACSNLEKARTVADVVVANTRNFNLQALLQAEIERQRLRKLRCHSPLLNPSSISGAAVHPNLGRAWVDELLRDCPEYAAFVAELVLRRAENAGVTLQEVSRERSK